MPQQILTAQIPGSVEQGQPVTLEFIYNTVPTAEGDPPEGEALSSGLDIALFYDSADLTFVEDSFNVPNNLVAGFFTATDSLGEDPGNDNEGGEDGDPETDRRLIINFADTAGTRFPSQGTEFVQGEDVLFEVEFNFQADTTVNLRQNGPTPNFDEVQPLDVQIPPPNEPPVANDDNVETNEDTVLNGDVLADNGNGEDTDPENDDLTVIEVNGEQANVGQPVTLDSEASVTLNADGTFSYDPTGSQQLQDLNVDETATETFTYTISDGNNNTATAQVSITINGRGENQAPTANDDAVSTNEDTVRNGNVLDNNGNGEDTDPENDDLTVTAVNEDQANVGQPVTLDSGASVTLNADGTFSYDPTGSQQLQELNVDETATETFTYTISDSEFTDTATVEITVNGVNDRPVANDDVVGPTDEETPFTFNVLEDNGNGPDSDIEGDPLTITAVNGNAINPGDPITLGSEASLTLNQDNTFSYDPIGAFDNIPAGGEGTDSFTYTISDGNEDATATVEITVQGLNDPPTAEPDDNTTPEDEVLNVVDAANGVLANDSDPDEGDTDALTVTAATDENDNAITLGEEFELPSGALLTLNPDGSYIYNPNDAFTELNDGETATDTFSYTVSDNDEDNPLTAGANVEIEITGVSPPFSLDVDDNGVADPFTDGLTIFRFLGELNPENFELAEDANRSAVEVQEFLNGATQFLDVDGNGETDPFTDGITIFRFLGELNPETFELAENATVDRTQVANDLQQFLPEGGLGGLG
jgi:VCBS repeat-containing protein